MTKSVQNGVNYLIPFLVGAMLISLSLRFTPKFAQVQSQQPSLVAPEHLHLFTLGYSAVVADGLWLRLIQDFDFCENRPAGVFDPSKFKCEKGWVFQMLKSLIEIDPRFKQPHLSGALMLTVIVNDIEGASYVFDRAVERFPNHWDVLFAAAYQAMVEEKNLAKASELLDRAGQHGAPSWTRSLAARLQQKSGQLELARSILENAASSASDEKSAELFQRRLVEVNAEIAKQQQQDQKH